MTGSVELQFLSRPTARGPRWGRVGRAAWAAAKVSRKTGLRGSKLTKPSCLQQHACFHRVLLGGG